ncbi:MAG: hypothetical protein KKI06_08370 [Euryarchaeota archaeon]|nr:hypothetical protein [Euryarchaeota archaeon]MBU4222154.1 hypothetical protein [Euryarchaeota archaeon]MCG2735296.1 hypothetical protein [Candidatus Methanoperedenaceae archaeon]
MTRHCSFKEAFIENQLDELQPGWRNGEDITSETKQKIKDYVASKMPKELIGLEECITDYSIWHMAKKIRERENLPKPQKSNKGNKVSVLQPAEEKTITSDRPKKTYRLRARKDTLTSDPGKEQDLEFVSADASVHAILIDTFRELLKLHGVMEFMAALFAIKNEFKTLETGDADTDSAGSEKGDI